MTSYDHWKQVPRNWSAWPWQHFKSEKMALCGAEKLVVEPRLPGHPDLFRLRLGGPVVVLSVFHTPYFNSKAGEKPREVTS
jgi:hypothetical protein